MRRNILFMVADCALLLAPGNSVGQESDREQAPAAGWAVTPIMDPLPGDSTAEDITSGADGLLDLLWDTFPAPLFHFGPPPAERVVILTFQESVDLLAHQHSRRLGASAPLKPLQGFAAFDLGASLANQDDFLRANHQVQDAALAMKMVLPDALRAWHVKIDARADTQQSGQVGLSVGVAQDLRNGAHVLYSTGIARRVSRNQPRQHAVGSAVNGGVQWKWRERLGIGVQFHYYPDNRKIDALMSLDVQSRVR